MLGQWGTSSDHQLDTPTHSLTNFLEDELIDQGIASNNAILQLTHLVCNRSLEQGSLDNRTVDLGHHFVIDAIEQARNHRQDSLNKSITLLHNYLNN
jgi:hypothetical protein